MAEESSPEVLAVDNRNFGGFGVEVVEQPCVHANAPRLAVPGPVTLECRAIAVGRNPAAQTEVMRDLPGTPGIGSERVAGSEPELPGRVVSEQCAAFAAEGAGAARQRARDVAVDFKGNLAAMTTATNAHACKTHGPAKRSAS